MCLVTYCLGSWSDRDKVAGSKGKSACSPSEYVKVKLMAMSFIIGICRLVRDKNAVSGVSFVMGALGGNLLASDPDVLCA